MQAATANCKASLHVSRRKTDRHGRMDARNVVHPFHVGRSLGLQVYPMAERAANAISLTNSHSKTMEPGRKTQNGKLPAHGGRLQQPVTAI